MKTIPRKETILSFYRYVWKSDFASIDEEKMKALDEAVEYWRYFFTGKSSSLLSMMTFAAEKMISSNGRYTAVTHAEKAYFYIKMIDPELLFLEAHESGNTMEEIRDLCMLNFKLYDPNLIRLEQRLYRVLKDVPEDLWTLERIKR
ncbi:MAG: hypothetical protein IJO63_04130 [Bacilli bacterium]|nr:hypothetical protein [Bacilli bacterium]